MGDFTQRNAQEVAKLVRGVLLASPGSLALIASRGQWRLARHLKLLDTALRQAIDDASAGRLEGLVVSMPPQHGKSELCSKYLPAWYLGMYPDRRVMLASYEADFAAQWGRKTRDLVLEWGPAFGVGVLRKSSAVHRWDLSRHTGGMTTAGVAGPLTGKGAHLLIIDDPIKNDAEARSALHRRKQFDWWQSTASTRLRPGGLVLVIQTRWHRHDLAGKILDDARHNGQRWREVRLPAIAEDADPLFRAPGQPLWPEVFSLEHLERIRARQTNYYWRSLYQQDPIAEGSAEWPERFFGPSIWFDDWPAAWEARVMALDPSKGRDARFGDYSAFVMLQLMRDGTMYVDANLEVRNVQVIVEQAVELCGAFRPCAFAVETNQFQELLAVEIARLGRSRGIEMPMIHVPNQVPKLLRIRRLTCPLAEGQFKFRRNSRGAQLLVQQLRDFPNGDHDDGPDAMEMAYRTLTELTAAPPRRSRIQRGVCISVKKNAGRGPLPARE